MTLNTPIQCSNFSRDSVPSKQIALVVTSHLQFSDKLHLPHNHIAISSHDLWYPFQSWDQSCRIPASIRPSTALKRPWPLPGLEGWWCQGRSISACTSQKAILLEGPSQPNDGTTYFEITLLFWLCSQNQPSSGGTWEQKFGISNTYIC